MRMKCRAHIGMMLLFYTSCSPESSLIKVLFQQRPEEDEQADTQGRALKAKGTAGTNSSAATHFLPFHCSTPAQATSHQA